MTPTAAPAWITTDIVAGLVAVGAFVLLSIAVRWILPWLVRGVLVPITGVLVVAVAVALLTVQAVAALPFRAIRIRPPGLVYAAGDTTVWLARVLRTRLSGLGRLSLGLRRVPGLLILLLLAAAAVGWLHEA